jgi:hypothetical protein
MSLTIFNHVADAEALAAAIPNLIAVVQSLSTDATFQAALAAAPHTHAEVTTLSALVRSLQNDVSGVLHDKNFFSILNAISHLVGDGGRLRAAFMAVQADPGVLGEIAASPVLQAKLEAVLSAWTPVQAALQSL